MKTKLNRDSIVRRCEGQVSCEIDEQIVVLSVEKGSYFQMDDVGSFIWNLVQTPLSVASLCQRLCEAFEVGEEQCELDTLSFLKAMNEIKLIEWDGVSPE